MVEWVSFHLEEIAYEEKKMVPLTEKGTHDEEDAIRRTMGYFVLSFAPKEKRAERMVAGGRRGKTNVEELKERKTGESNGVKERRATEKKRNREEEFPKGECAPEKAEQQQDIQ
ncbi:hypothetical protein Cni_G16448 [Canna indica]|uniref:Uncharacterized protein n=1 Tax=Canna indica TaxID=4628 RepID=A0AAQ3QCK3_9LILI|nr:hypothetical protein Cni_G16448 [Canna indica]